MLDDLKFIHEKDAQDSLGIAEKEPDQLLKTFEFAGNKQFNDIRNVVYAGMGGSALAATLVRAWPGLSVPFEIVRDYSLPKYVNHYTLVILSSYSGNTEETLHALGEAQGSGAQIGIITGGGKLWEAAQTNDYLRVLIPDAAQPRYAVLYSYKALLDLLLVTRLLEQDVSSDLQTAAAFMKQSLNSWLPTVPTSHNPAKQLAHELIGKSIVLYAGPKLAAAAYKWKISFNENAKQIAWWNTYPEFNHNEFIGWSKQPVDKPYAVVDLRGSCESEKVLKRFELSAKLLSGMRPEPHVVMAQGKNDLEQLLWTVLFGDFVSLYVALLNGLNPAPVDLVEKFKRELADTKE
jgi:glucose/mannose-6-phosphate isomerase